MHTALLALVLLMAWAVTASADITTGLVGWWKMDEGSGTTVADSGSSGSTGTIPSAPNAPAWQSGASCKAGACLLFDGSNDYVTISGGPLTAIPITAHSVCLWAKVTDISATGGAASQTFLNLSSNSDNMMRMGSDYAPDGYFYFTARMNSVETYGKITTSAVFANGVWTHACYTVTPTGPSTHLYINAVDQSLAACNYSRIEGNLLGGKAVTSGNFGGVLDDVRVYNRVLSQADVTEVFNVMTLVGTTLRRNVQY